jgi:hypothetical protein
MTVQEWACLGSCGHTGILVVDYFASTGLQVQAMAWEKFRQRSVAGRLRAVEDLARQDYWRPIITKHIFFN